MPTERFLNLPAEKQARILSAAEAELARVPLAQASINKIVQAAGIPRGSFYQYFSDKIDLFEHLMQGYRRLLRDRAQQSLKKNRGNLFPVVLDLFDCTLDFGCKSENYNLCCNLFSSVGVGEECAFGVKQFNTTALLADYRGWFDLTAYRDPSDAAVENLLEVLIIVLGRAAAKAFADLENRGQARERLAGQLEMLEHGVLKQQSSNDKE